MSPETFRDLLFSLTGLSFGAAGYALFAYTFGSLRETDPESAVGHMLVKISWILTLGTIFVTILIPATEIPITTPGIAYIVGIVLGSVGFVMVARSERRRDKGSAIGAS